MSDMDIEAKQIRIAQVLLKFSKIKKKVLLIALHYSEEHI
jgi:hypothetical protein